jgi:hypothetical protein
MDFDRGLIVCNNSVLAVPLLNEATNDNFFSSDPVTFEQVSDIRGTALNRVFVIGKLKGRSGGNDLVRLSMFARSLFMSVLLTRSAPISDLSFAGAGAGLVYTRNGVANAGISAGTSRRMFGFGTYDEEVHEVLAGENAVVFANPQPGNGVSFFSLTF